MILNSSLLVTAMGPALVDERRKTRRISEMGWTTELENGWLSTDAKGSGRDEEDGLLLREYL